MLLHNLVRWFDVVFPDNAVVSGVVYLSCLISVLLIYNTVRQLNLFDVPLVGTSFTIFVKSLLLSAVLLLCFFTGLLGLVPYLLDLFGLDYPFSRVVHCDPALDKIVDQFDRLPSEHSFLKRLTFGICVGILVSVLWWFMGSGGVTPPPSPPVVPVTDVGVQTYNPLVLEISIQTDMLPPSYNDTVGIINPATLGANTANVTTITIDAAVSPIQLPSTPLTDMYEVRDAMVQAIPDVSSASVQVSPAYDSMHTQTTVVQLNDVGVQTVLLHAEAGTGMDAVQYTDSIVGPNCLLDSPFFAPTVLPSAAVPDDPAFGNLPILFLPDGLYEMAITETTLQP